ncbi:MAG TPA: class II aldolase/adducin family protein [Haliangiales bacterium]|nr:class II aldolase/adducin family protein [Haliangiales bacterium]
MTERALREACAEVARALHARGWVANHDGNVTCRVDAGRFLCTPTAVSKRVVGAAGLLVVDADGKRISGDGKPFSEIGLHLTVYKNRPDVRAVAHAHPPAATGIACAGGRQLERPFLAEAVVSLGPSIATVPFAAPGAEACAALAPFCAGADAVLLANHGVLAWGADLEQAYLRLELVEHLARIALEAERAGGLRSLPDAALAPLLEARRKAGLGNPTPTERPGGAPSGSARWGGGEGSQPPHTIVACAPAPHAEVPTIAPGRAKPAELADIIREELLRALKS